MHAVPGRVYNLVVVIVHYRTPEIIIDCLETLLPELYGLDARVVMVDNHSKDNSPQKIQNWLSVYDREQQVLFVQSKHNGGFASGNNIGIRTLKAENYLLLNSDTLVRPSSIRMLLKTATKFPDAGLYSPRLEWPGGQGQESCFRFHSPVSEFLASAKTGVLDKLFSKFVVAMAVQQKMTSPDWTSFACVMIKGKVFADIGMLDYGYFMYYEDVELCYRAKRAGWKILHNPECRVVHLRGGSSPVKEQVRLKNRVQKYYYESRTRFFFQAYGWWGLTAANLLWCSGRVISKLRQLSGRKDKSEVTRRWLDIWTNWTSPLKYYTHPDSQI